ncbi:hypothetical protein P2H44_15005 [Albimonas sp. CAU 1670]|uniref:hypothetical protein n=1 Tax=Albimonas sp. CAU 1670 TaxID=3032599 RepID=UPI0023DC712E|nr:hypothetical protein [Albimonas sp. CAU 1670]MDF2233867.1 hypothetical protein [Albimonas sp. CAU 1670]
MSTRRARPILTLTCAPALCLALSAGLASAVQQDPAEQPGHLALVTAPDSTAASPGEANLLAWPCMEGPGCGDAGDAAARRAAEAAAAQKASMDATAIPLPAALGLMGAGMTALGLFMRRRRED